MATYTVEIRLPMTQFTTVTVEANSADEAAGEAFAMLHAGLTDDWNDDPDSCGTPYIGDCELNS